MAEFIQITEPEDVVVVDNFIRRARWTEGGFTPDDAMAVLSKTNHFYNIKTVVKEINKLEVEERKAYKDFVLGAVNGREITAEVLDSLKELARSGGYEEEFNEANSKDKYFAPTDWNVFIAKSKDDFKNDLSAYGTVFCDFVDEYGYVDLGVCDLQGLNLKFKKGAKVNLGWAKNLPKDLDLSQCYGVCLCKAKNLPLTLDVSMCDEVWLDWCDLQGLNLKFKEGAKVDLEYAKNLPKDLNFSQCDEVWLEGCDLSGVESIKFKDNAQKEEFMKDSKNFSGKVVYTDIKVQINNKVER